MLWMTLMTENRRNLRICEAGGADGRAVFAYLEKVSEETGYLTFDLDKFDLSAAEEAADLMRCREAENCLYLLAPVDPSRRARCRSLLATVPGSGTRANSPCRCSVPVGACEWPQPLLMLW
jgi:hypothetical protein